MDRLIDKLEKIGSLPMHMPGHKRNYALAPYLKRLCADLDITEIDGFDNLHNAEGILKESMQECAGLKGAKRAFYLVNGSTCGNLAAVYAVINRGDKVICARNCHKSIYNALEVAGAKPIFIMPDREEKTGACGKINPRAIETAIGENPSAKLVIITSPTYEGIISDVAKICRIAHKHSIPVLVDAAHGAHFGLDGFPEAITALGADIVVESLHKTMPSLTQTAVMYLSGELVSPEKIAAALAIFETSSPSYLLLASLDACTHLVKESGARLSAEWNKNLDAFYENTKGLKKLQLLKPQKDFDRSKIVIFGTSGTKLAEALRKEGIEPEMVSAYYVVLMTGVGDTAESIKKLSDTLLKIDKGLEKSTAVLPYPDIPERVMLPKEAQEKACEAVEVSKADGRIAAEYVFAYPPGIPLILPGERISADICRLFDEYEKNKVELLGSFLHARGEILVIKS